MSTPLSHHRKYKAVFYATYANKGLCDSQEIEECHIVVINRVFRSYIDRCRQRKDRNVYKWKVLQIWMFPLRFLKAKIHQNKVSPNINICIKQDGWPTIYATVTLFHLYCREIYILIPDQLAPVFWEKMEDIWLIPMTKAPIITENSKSKVS